MSCSPYVNSRAMPHRQRRAGCRRGRQIRTPAILLLSGAKAGDSFPELARLSPPGREVFRGRRENPLFAAAPRTTLSWRSRPVVLTNRVLRRNQVPEIVEADSAVRQRGTGENHRKLSTAVAAKLAGKATRIITLWVGPSGGVGSHTVPANPAVNDGMPPDLFTNCRKQTTARRHTANPGLERS
jgi:hypothetical protein